MATNETPKWANSLLIKHLQQKQERKWVN